MKESGKQGDTQEEKERERKISERGWWRKNDKRGKEGMR